MVKAHDIVVLVRLVTLPAAWTVRSLAEDLEFAPASVHRSLKRLAVTGLFDLDRGQTNPILAHEFLVHAVRFVAPAALGVETTGMPTAWMVEPLKSEFAAGSEGRKVVWPDPLGRRRGQALEPLDNRVPRIARRDRAMYAMLSLVDAVRVGDARERAVASRLIGERIDDALIASAA